MSEGFVHGSTQFAANEDRRVSPARAPVAACGIAVMAKASTDGRAKTRLVPPLSYREAAAFNTAFLKDIAENLCSAGRQASIAGYMAFGPPGSEQFFRDNLPCDIGLIEVWLPGFGDCLHRAVQEVLARGHRGAVVLNSDSPTLPTSLLVEAANVLAQPGDRAVLGPAGDGGYYLLGLKQAHPRMFDGIEWSTSRVADQTMARAREIGLDVHVLAPWYDVDDIDALRILHAELNAGHSFHDALAPHRASHTAELMQSLLLTTDLAQRLNVVRALEGAAL
jgi:rSAM/selenodomain-associated transferase 1